MTSAPLEKQGNRLIEFRTDIRPTNEALNALNADAWDHTHVDTDYDPVLDRSLGYVCAFAGSELIGFVNIAWDGGVHAFILDTCVAPDYRRQGVAQDMVKMAISLAKQRGAAWLHVDFEPHLKGFYRGCGFAPTLAGIIDLTA